MFTGIISAIGTITQITPLETGLRLTIQAPALDLSDVALGDSIAHNGVCLTVISKESTTYQVDVSRETLDCTVGLDGVGGVGGANEVNLEKALRLADRLGGHLVAGHVDGVGEVIRLTPVGESHELVIRAPHDLAKTIAPKGSITVNGVSLTTNRITNADFSINLIPHTMAMTTLHHLRVGSRVNLEVDLIARYVERILIASAAA
ncbi:riboflavin synthase subunit alpha [Rugosibacter aromaticivorans]|uniref:Riboflavin synthase n=1 Tax=Rugosibacter aromaticivorans TaxID=1565605 RepID=A0A0C5J633_9PROT|nr:riboflavin synthase [Rugosibacter aromaticivorans]AJP47455.1 riboflavin synthase subunit alpha [Rugosibacter aromaticivorans]TBR15689.1 MAG: riboflavin synthase [Rugosibacter sp.]